MKNELFEVRPVVRYHGARYPSTWAPEPRAEEEEKAPGLLVFLLAIVLVVGLSLGMIGCFADYRSDLCPDGQPRDASGDCGGDGPDGPDDECQPGALACEDGALLACNDDGQTWTSQDCEMYCNQMYGLDSYSTGCDAEAEDPCGCEYDIIDGDIAECTPGDFYCIDYQTVAICNEDQWMFTEQDCDEYCNEVHGPGYSSYGCDSQAEEPCACEYDVPDGVIAYCTPGQSYCVDEDTVAVCDDDEINWTEHDCDVYCTDTFGEDYYATVCDAGDQDNPCGCEYGIVDGEPVEP